MGSDTSSARIEVISGQKPSPFRVERMSRTNDYLFFPLKLNDGNNIVIIYCLLSVNGRISNCV